MKSASDDIRVLRYPRWRSVLAVLLTIVFLAAAVYFAREGTGWLTLAFGLFVLFVLASLVDEAITRVELRSDELRIIRPWTWRSLRRDDVRSVACKRGCPATIEIEDGRWVELPGVERTSRSLAGAVRSWLRRTR